MEVQKERLRSSMFRLFSKKLYYMNMRKIKRESKEKNENKNVKNTKKKLDTKRKFERKNYNCLNFINQNSLIQNSLF